MTQLSVLEYSLDELRNVIIALDDAEMDVVSNCVPWTVRRLASHALNNQLLWAGRVTGEDLVSAEDTMGAVAYDGDLAAYADDVAHRALALWRRDGVLSQTHVTPLGELPGTVVINFPTIDAFAHAWDISASSATRSSSHPRSCRRSPPSSPPPAPTRRGTTGSSSP